MGSRYDFEYYIACGQPQMTSVEHQGGILLIGGAEEEKSGERPATEWFLQRAKRGNYLVLRVGGIGGQADWIAEYYSDWVNSASELTVDSREAANHPEVIEYLEKADFLFIAGGNQTHYKNYWEDTAMEDTINFLIQEKKVPIAGTSAGMAILGDYYYAPENKGVLTSEILDDPFHFHTKTICHSDFIQLPYLEQVLTDTHLDRVNEGYPETRYGRLLGLMARAGYDYHKEGKIRAIGLEEGAFVAIDDRGVAQVFGNGSHLGQDAYFLQALDSVPEQLEPGWPLVWDNQGKAVKVYQIAGDPQGSGRFDLTNWTTASGGKWAYWYTVGGKSGLKKEILP